jgi:hypothetical protein
MRRRLFAVAALAVCGAAAGPNEFLKNNPGYRARAGAFYEQKYLPEAAADLVKAVASPNLTDEKARALLKGYIYDWLGCYCEGNGSVTRADLDGLLRALDNKVKAALNDEAAFARYQAWRRTADRQGNALAFLFVPQ